MGSLKLSTFAIVVCLSILLISPIGKGLCRLADTISTCDVPCRAVDSKYHGGECLNVGGGQGICWCCRDYDAAKSGAEKESM
ncbi:Defensin-like protein 95 [Arabidopsis thaliana]